jgi:hypothetical protein
VLLAPGTVTLPLCSQPNASLFWIMLLLVSGRLEHGMISVAPAQGAPFPSCSCGYFASKPQNKKGPLIAERPFVSFWRLTRLLCVRQPTQSTCYIDRLEALPFYY